MRRQQHRQLLQNPPLSISAGSSDLLGLLSDRGEQVQLSRGGAAALSRPGAHNKSKESRAAVEAQRTGCHLRETQEELKEEWRRRVEASQSFYFAAFSVLPTF